MLYSMTHFGKVGHGCLCPSCLPLSTMQSHRDRFRFLFNDSSILIKGRYDVSSG
jgi:hypothetical protein